MSLFTSAPVPAAPTGRRSPAAAGSAPASATAGAASRPRPDAEPDAGPAARERDQGPGPEDAGYVLFSVDGTTMAVPIGDVREIARSPRLTRLPVLDSVGFGRGLALVDVRGRSVPVVDLRTHPGPGGDVLLPLWRRHAGLVVDHVVAVTGPGELVGEPRDAADVLPHYARGVVRPADGGDPVVVVDLPAADRATGGSGPSR
jgi:chemotaxis signal transduction protein